MTDRLGMNPAQFLKAVESGKQFPVLLLYGEEEYLIREAARLYLDRIADETTRQFDVAEFRGEDVDSIALWNALTTLPLLAAKRVVVIDTPTDLSEKAKERLERYLAHVAPTTLLCMTEVLEDKRTTLPWSGMSGVTSVHYPALSREAERRAWVQSAVKRAGRTIDADALDYVTANSPADLGELAAKLRSVMMYLGDAGQITLASVVALGGESPELNLFKLEDAILKGKRAEALRTARGMIEGGSKVLGLLGYHRRTVYKLWRLSAIRGEVSEADARKILGGQTFKLPDFRSAARRLGAERIREFIRELLEVEIAGKTGGGEESALGRYYSWLWKISVAGERAPEASRGQELR